jgi:hypothetical protein
MTGWFIVTLVFMGPAFTIAQAVTGVSFAVLAWPVAAIFLVAAVLTHRSYAQARRALAGDPTLRGGWLVRNLWWAGLVALFAANILVALIVYSWPLG